MTLFALANILDEARIYQAAAKRLIRRRFDILYHSIGFKPSVDENSVDYYTVIDLQVLSKEVYSEEFSNWLMKQVSGYDFLKRLAKETGVVLLPGKGFEVEHPSVRVSLANLTEYNYKSIGASVKKILNEYHESYSS